MWKQVSSVIIAGVVRKKGRGLFIQKKNVQKREDASVYMFVELNAGYGAPIAPE